MFGQSGKRSVRSSPGPGQSLFQGLGQSPSVGGAARRGLQHREMAPGSTSGDASRPVAARDDAVPPSDAPASGGRGKPSILVADDNDNVVESLAMLLEINGYAVIKAYDGLQAVAAVEREQPDIVLLDIGMPGLDGHAACRRIRALPQGERLRIIALSGWSLESESDRRRSAESGFDSHLVKPVESAALFRLLGCC